MKSFQQTLAEAIRDIADNGFDSQERIDRWLRELRIAAERKTMSAASVESMMRDALTAIYTRLVERGSIFRFAPGVPYYTLEKVKPKLRGELDRRIAASANLIKLNREEAINKTLRRFQGWSTSIPPGGVPAEDKRKVKAEIRKSLASLPFEERRVLIDQSKKLTDSLANIVAVDNGAIAGVWRSNFRQQGYDARPDHIERDSKFYLIRGSWAHQAGLVKPGPFGYTDDITSPGQEIFCRCVPGSTRIPFANIKAISRRWYDGPSVAITTVSGRHIVATPNHPILSPLGWRRADSFDIGDDVVELLQEEANFSVSECDHDDRIPSLVEIFSSLAEVGARYQAPGRRDDFHGDGIVDQKVDVVTPTRALLIDYVTSQTKGLSEFIFSNADAGKLAFGSASKELVFLRWIRVLLSNALSSLVPDFLRLLLHSQFLSLGYAAQGSANRNQTPSDSCSGNAKVFGNWLDPNPAIVGLNNSRNIKFKTSTVAQVHRGTINGHVYNLETKDGWYAADGIITHNCYYVYRFNLRDLPDDMLTAKGRAALARARENIYASVVSGRTDNAGEKSINGEPERGGSESMADSQDHEGDESGVIASLDRLGFLQGLGSVRFITDEDKWHAEYDDEQDQITLESKFFDLPPQERMHVFLHEAGHRGQFVESRIYHEFLREHLDRLDSFVNMANEEHIEDFRERGIGRNVLADEVFAESYSRACLSLDMPFELRKFWYEKFDAAGLRGQNEVNYIDVWRNKITRCQRCSMFLRVGANVADNACVAVEGLISAHGHCKLFRIDAPVA